MRSRRPYRELARKWHPDRNPDDADAEERFKEIQQAYDALSDPEKRKQYDSAGASADSGRAAFPPGGGGFPGGGAGGGFTADLGDIFSSFFGRGRQQARPSSGAATSRRGPPLLRPGYARHADRRVGADDRTVRDPAAATAAKPGTSPRTCPRCEGTGIDAQSQGLFSISQPCPSAVGRGA